MQTVGAQWLLLDEPNATTLVALVQTMSMLPVLLLALPSGVIADSFDRRRWLVLVQSCSFVVAATLAVLTAVDQPSPALLLAFTFLLGCGAALVTPAWLAIIPDLVPRSQLPAAAALGSISINVARAVGPAAAGVLISLAGVPIVFAFNALSYAVPAVALLVWGPAPAVSGDIPERFVPALRAGARYIRHSLITRRILLRSILFVAPGASLWALLPLVATERLGLDAAGFGFLLGAVGVGAVGGAFVMPRLRSRVSVGQLIGGASLVYALALLTLALVTNVPLVVAVLLLAGAAWLAVLASLGAAMQMFLPTWVRARGLSAHTVVFVGGQAVGALVWGVLGQYAGLVVALVAAAAVTAVGAATLAAWPLIDASRLDRGTVSYWSEPNLAFEPDPDEGPVLISLTYSVPRSGPTGSWPPWNMFDGPGSGPVPSGGGCTRTGKIRAGSSRCTSSRPGRSTSASTATGSPEPTRRSKQPRSHWPTDHLRLRTCSAPTARGEGRPIRSFVDRQVFTCL